MNVTMKMVEIRRHSLADSQGNLSPEGIDVARAARRSLELGYIRLLSSPKARAVQTLTELGGEKIEYDDRFGTLPGDRLAPFDAKVKSLMSERKITLLQAYFEIAETRAILEEKGREMLQAVVDIARALPEGGKALIVSHGGSIEPAAILAMRREFSLQAIGGELGLCEGVRFFLEDDQVRRVDIVRLAR